MDTNIALTSMRVSKAPMMNWDIEVTSMVGRIQNFRGNKDKLSG
tara:strand:- start:358 stop:489 length:132 start_codon:yes stop_codon:yes gene_type:complete